MHKQYAVLLMCILQIQCSGEKEGKNEIANKARSGVTEQINSISRKELSSFPYYEYKIQDTLHRTWKSGGQSIFKNLGNCTIKNNLFKAVTEFRLIPVANGMKGKSKFYLITLQSDTLEFNVDMPEHLPIDIHKNNFVFIGNKNQYIFAKIELTDEELVCFSGANFECFTGQIITN